MKILAAASLCFRFSILLKPKKKISHNALTILLYTGKGCIFMNEKTNDFRISISCATDPGKHETNRDCCGYRYDSKTVISGMESFSFADDIDSGIPLLAAVADGKVLFDDPESIKDCSQHKAVDCLLNQLFENYFKDEQKKEAANQLNRYLLDHCDAEYPGVGMAAIGIKDDMIHTMHTGNCAVIRIHENTAERLTPLKMSRVAETYIGSPDAPGEDMCVFTEYPLCKGDTWILATDGVTDPFTQMDYVLDSDHILWLLSLDTPNPAAILVRSAAETNYPVYEQSYCPDSHTAIVIRIDDAENASDPV